MDGTKIPTATTATASPTGHIEAASSVAMAAPTTPIEATCIAMESIFIERCTSLEE